MDCNLLQQMLTSTIFLQLTLISYVFVNGRICFKTDRTNNEKVKFCCRNYEMKNGKCIECSDGFTSNNGESCKLCPGKTYGPRCIYPCNCTEKQMCHHISGCLRLQSTSSNTIFKDSTELIQWLTTSDTKMKDIDYNESKNALLNQKIVIYTMCIAGLLVVITICYVCVKRLNSRRTRNGLRENSNTKREHEQNRQNGNRRALPSIVLPSNQINERRYESCYDEIDETKINETKTPLEKNGNASFELSSDNSESENDAKLEGDGYLNPYQPMVNDPDTHDYKTASKPMEYQLHNKQEIGYVDAMSSNLPIERKYLEIVDEPRVGCLKGKVITKPSNDLHLNIPNTSQYSRMVDVQKYHKNSASTLQLSSKTNPSEQKHVLNKRLSI